MPKATNKLTTVQEVLNALGPVSSVMKLTQTKNYQTIHNWKDRGVFPANLHLVMTKALAAKGLEADPALWQQVQTPPPIAGAEAAAAAPVS